MRKTKEKVRYAKWVDVKNIPPRVAMPVCLPLKLFYSQSIWQYKIQIFAKTWGLLGSAEWHQTLLTNMSKTSPLNILHSWRISKFLVRPCNSTLDGTWRSYDIHTSYISQFERREKNLDFETGNTELIWLQKTRQRMLDLSDNGKKRVGSFIH